MIPRTQKKNKHPELCSLCVIEKKYLTNIWKPEEKQDYPVIKTDGQLEKGDLQVALSQQ